MDTDSSAPSTPVTHPAPPAANFNSRRVIVVAFGAVIICAAVLVLFGFGNGLETIQDWMRPPLVRAEGTITFGGRPLRRGMIVTRPVDGNLKGSVGFIDDQGHFVLKTDIKGDFVEGAYPGQHQVTVEVYQNLAKMGAAQAPSLVPEKYTSFGSSPLKLDLSPSSDKNRFELALEADEQHQPEAAGSEEVPAAVEASAGAAENQEAKQ